MSRFNCRPIARPGPPPMPFVPADKKPSAYAALKGREDKKSVELASMISHVSSFADEPEARKRGRPSKDELRKKKMALASASIAMLVNDKPTKKKIQEYVERRIAELNEEKR